MDLDKWQMSGLQFGAFEWNGVGAKKIGSIPNDFSNAYTFVFVFS